MDYMDKKKIKFYKNFQTFIDSKNKKRIVLITTKAKKAYTDFNFRSDDTILFGRETAGVPKEVHDLVDTKLKIPMIKNKRSLNLASSVAIILSEQIRQIKKL